MKTVIFLLVFILGTSAYSEDTAKEYNKIATMIQKLNALERNMKTLELYNVPIGLCDKLKQSDKSETNQIAVNWLLIECYSKQARYKDEFELFWQNIDLIGKVYCEDSAVINAMKYSDKYYELEEYDFSRNILDKILQKYPDSKYCPHILYKVAKIYEEEKDKLDYCDRDKVKTTVEEIYRKIMKSYKGTKYARRSILNLTSMTYIYDRSDTAERKFHDLIKETDDEEVISEIKYYLGKFYFDEGKQKQALEIFTELEEKYKEYIDDEEIGKLIKECDEYRKE